jgi:uncharacterized membrane protein YphA (DoxX/SURF4 family)
MTLGFFANSAVLICFLGSLLQVRWNALPLTAGHGVLLATLFCLIWADCGARLSLDRRRRQRRQTLTSHEGASVSPDPDERALQPMWPLRLIRVQVALIYFTSGFFKLFGAAWRDGSAVHYTTAQNVFGRVLHVYPLPASLDWTLTVLTYTTLVWELIFFLLLLNRFTRKVALGTGVAIHLGIWVTMEVGPFSWMMLAAYVAFLDPRTAERVALGGSRLQVKLG